MAETPEDLRYTSSHEWIRKEGDLLVIGITDHAQEALNDIVFVELPDEGAHFEAEDEFGVVESVKSVSELYLPVAGAIAEANTSLEDAPETLNSDPYGEGWLIKVKPDDPSAYESLLSAADYLASIE